MQTKWRIALFGVGHWHAAMHLDAALHAGAHVIGVWDEDQAVAISFAEQHGLEALSFEALLAAAPDIAILMGHPLHVPQQAMRIVETVPTLVLEKPAVPTSSDLDTIAAAAERHGCHIAIPFGHRLSPVLERRSQLEAEGRSGRLVQLHFRIVNGSPRRYRDQGVGWLLDPEISGGGALRNIGIHGVDLILAHATGPLEIISAQILNTIHDEPVEDYAHVVLRDAAGVLFTLEAGYTFPTLAPGGDFELRLVTTNAVLHDHGSISRCATLDDGRNDEIHSPPPGLRYRDFLRDTLNRIEAGQGAGVTLHDYRTAMDLIDRIYERAKT
ncbi:Gfo/Idh/MocA family oxidoreductase [Devosia sp. YIM 151766]|uniref:Gfo/Idh/MocA family protein n=1 Tax=Devosia sp. YIM 151766 TaxID=3017325 RepID=UPI00255CE217|nr:Gfo/Idh/MocA family oxidoreductase [Devosia sp. YIM 151766]WIY54519.1 Gfo/Idh/MocA family oxidoreductase [Devosia sp. YIM 151766]